MEEEKSACLLYDLWSDNVFDKFLGKSEMDLSPVYLRFASGMLCNLPRGRVLCVVQQAPFLSS